MKLNKILVTYQYGTKKDVTKELQTIFDSVKKPDTKEEYHDALLDAVRGKFDYLNLDIAEDIIEQYLSDFKEKVTEPIKPIVVKYKNGDKLDITDEVHRTLDSVKKVDDKEYYEGMLWSRIHSQYNDIFTDELIDAVVSDYLDKNELTEAVSNGIYSLKKGWIKVPEKDNIPEPVDISDKVEDLKLYADGLDEIEDIDKFINDLYVMRQDSILKDGEYGEGNLIFKELRNQGVLHDLKERKVELENQEMSL